jgi:hypothetical protein
MVGGQSRRYKVITANNLCLPKINFTDFTDYRFYRFYESQKCKSGHVYAAGRERDVYTGVISTDGVRAALGYYGITSSQPTPLLWTTGPVTKFTV